MTLVIDAMDNRDADSADIPCAFVQADILSGEHDEDLHIMIEGRMVQPLAKLNPPTYGEYFHTHQGQVMICVKLKKYFYGTIKATLLFWKNYQQV